MNLRTKAKMINKLQRHISIFPPEHLCSVRVETCSVAADWGGGGLLDTEGMTGGREKVGKRGRDSENRVSKRM